MLLRCEGGNDVGLLGSRRKRLGNLKIAGVMPRVSPAFFKSATVSATLPSHHVAVTGTSVACRGPSPPSSASAYQGCIPIRGNHSAVSLVGSERSPVPSRIRCHPRSRPGPDRSITSHRRHHQRCHRHRHLHRHLYRHRCSPPPPLHHPLIPPSSPPTRPPAGASSCRRGASARGSSSPFRPPSSRCRGGR